VPVSLAQSPRHAPYFTKPESAATPIWRSARWVAVLAAVVIGLVILACALPHSLPHAPKTQDSAAPAGPSAAAGVAPSASDNASGSAPLSAENPIRPPPRIVINPQAPDPAAPPPGPDFPGLQVAAQEQVEAILPEIRGVQFRDVRTNLSTQNGQTRVDFCGEVNTRDPMGAYVGFQKFISSAEDAKIELAMAPGAFAQAWGARCTGAAGPKVWN